jgi:tetratricopeptide (TPR) repeat protein
MSNRCDLCHRELEPTYHFAVAGQPTEPMVTHAVWATTSRGRIGVCNICYEQKKFDRLTDEDIGTLHYMFGDPYSEDSDDYAVSLARLRRAFALCPYPEVEGALGYAYWKLGRKKEAIRHCRSALTRQPNHFGASKAFYVLKREDADVREFTQRLRAAGRRIKSLAAEFPRQRIKKPRHDAKN